MYKYNIFVNYFELEFKDSEAKVSTSQNFSTSRNAQPLAKKEYNNFKEYYFSQTEKDFTALFPLVESIIEIRKNLVF